MESNNLEAASCRCSTLLSCSQATPNDLSNLVQQTRLFGMLDSGKKLETKKGYSWEKQYYCEICTLFVSVEVNFRFLAARVNY
jgi:hypothetical protein